MGGRCGPIRVTPSHCGGGPVPSRSESRWAGGAGGGRKPARSRLRQTRKRSGRPAAGGGLRVHMPLARPQRAAHAAGATTGACGGGTATRRAGSIRVSRPSQPSNLPCRAGGSFFTAISEREIIIALNMVNMLSNEPKHGEPNAGADCTPARVCICTQWRLLRDAPHTLSTASVCICTQT